MKGENWLAILGAVIIGVLLPLAALILAEGFSAIGGFIAMIICMFAGIVIGYNIRMED